MVLDLIRNPSLKERTTLRLGGTAEAEVVLRDERDLDELSSFLTQTTLRPFVIGQGSNLLAPEGHMDMVLLSVDAHSGPDRVEKQDDTLIVRAGADLRLPGLLGWAQKAGLTGLEPLTGIPGSVGGAVAMNAGSYATEIGDLITRVQVWTPTGGLQWIDKADCTFEYRHFSCAAPAGKYVIWAVELALKESSPKRVHAAMRATYTKKQATQPVTAWSAGCVFKNPEGESAGRLLDQAGMKGVRLGDMAFSEVHANFLVNLGQGTSDHALELIEKGRAAVMDRFDITLETEVILL